MSENNKIFIHAEIDFHNTTLLTKTIARTLNKHIITIELVKELSPKAFLIENVPGV